MLSEYTLYDILKDNRVDSFLKDSLFIKDVIYSRFSVFDKKKELDSFVMLVCLLSFRLSSLSRREIDSLFLLFFLMVFVRPDGTLYVDRFLRHNEKLFTNKRMFRAWINNLEKNGYLDKISSNEYILTSTTKIKELLDRFFKQLKKDMLYIRKNKYKVTKVVNCFLTTEQYTDIF